MSFCIRCGAGIEETTMFCPNCGNPCGAAVQQPLYQQAYAPEVRPSGLAVAAKVLMIISTVVMGLYIIPLAWCLPMTISYNKKIKAGIPVSVGFKICTLLFVNTIAGILMLCDNGR